MHACAQSCHKQTKIVAIKCFCTSILRNIRVFVLLKAKKHANKIISLGAKNCQITHSQPYLFIDPVPPIISGFFGIGRRCSFGN